jgi:hypothetical protein
MQSQAFAAYITSEVALCLSLTQSFAQDGLRTLCCAVKDISPAYFHEWKIRHHAARYRLSIHKYSVRE